MMDRRSFLKKISAGFVVAPLLSLLKDEPMPSNKTEKPVFNWKTVSSSILINKNEPPTDFVYLLNTKYLKIEQNLRDSKNAKYLF